MIPGTRITNCCFMARTGIHQSFFFRPFYPWPCLLIPISTFWLFGFCKFTYYILFTPRNNQLFYL